MNFYLGLCNELFKAVEYPRESVELYDFQRWGEKIDEIERLLLQKHMCPLEGYFDALLEK